MKKKEKLEMATFAGGCFWCIEAAFILMPGVTSVVSGYAGGEEVNPSYEEVSGGETGHREAVQITFDSKKTSYDNLLNFFWKHIDPTDANGQFVDRGPQYRAAIFYHNPQQKKTALASKQKLEQMKKFDCEIVTDIIPFTTFYPAEAYHQKYHEKNFLRYTMYRLGSGRDQFLKKVWGETYHDISPYEKTREKINH